jgi:hypothetical protein
LLIQKEQKNAARTFDEGLFGRALRNWRSSLNIEFVCKGKDARDVYGYIPLSVWEEFVEQKNTTEAVAQSVQQKEKAMKAAENPHHGFGRICCHNGKMEPGGRIKEGS